jgi:hypothetical protein
MTNTQKPEMHAGRKVGNYNRPAGMPRTAVQIGGVWYRNQREARRAGR